MTEFAFDTSGFVNGRPEGIRTRRWYWSDLDPFTRGYIEAMFASLDRDFMGEPRLREQAMDAEGVTSYLNVGFSDLSPEALASILADCGRVVRAYSGGATAQDGREFWAARQTGRIVNIPPVSVHLGDDGKIHLSERS
jgi:hypothetical protein